MNPNKLLILLEIGLSKPQNYTQHKLLSIKYQELTCKYQIKSIKNQLIFKCQGSFASAEIIRSESDGMGFIQKHNKVIQGEFSLKNLGYFIKCTNLCPQIEVYLENDLPLVVKYNVATLGHIQLCLAPLPGSS